MGPALVCRDQHRGHRNTKEGLGAEGLAAAALIPGNFLVEKAMVHKSQHQLYPRDLVFSAKVKLVLSSCRNYFRIKTFF